MPGPKGVFKSVGKKLKKVFSKKKNRNQRARRHAGLPQQPGGGQAPQIPGHQQGGIVENRGPRGWIGGQRQNERGGMQIGQNRVKTTTENPVETPVVEQTNPYTTTQTPYTQSKNPYATNPYASVTFDADDTGSISASNKGSNSNDGTHESAQQKSESQQSTKAKTEEVPPNPYQGGKAAKNPYEFKPVLALDSANDTISSSLSSSSVSADSKEKARQEAEQKALKLKVDQKVGERITALQKKKKKQKQKSKDSKSTEVTSDGYQTNKVTSGGYQTNEVTSNGYQTNEVTSNGYQANKVTSNGYQTNETNPYQTTAPYEASQDDDVPTISSSSVATAKIEVTQEERTIIQAQVERELGYGSPDVQGIFKGDGIDEPTSTMMRSLRTNSEHAVDAQEIVHGKSHDIKRTQLSPNEKESKGWALTALRDTYIEQDAYKGKHNSFNTKYLFSETTQLEGSVRALGSQQEHGREKLVIHYEGGQWIDADNKAVDTSQAGEMQYAISMRQQALQEKIDKAKSNTNTERDTQALALLCARIDKLKFKQNNAHTHKSVTGKYIYVMNASGELFAAKAMQYVIHHSSFLAGGAVASAGEVGISGGKLDYISNQSGHYRPGPVYLWQAVKQLELNGCPLEAVTVHVMGVKSKFKNAKDFLNAMDPAADPRFFDSIYAINHLNDVVVGLKAQKDVA